MPVTDFFVDSLALRNTMTVPVEKSDGAILGLEGDVLGGAAFVYDRRGPKTSPAIEVQSWIEPELIGTPADDPTAAGIQALGFSVPDLIPAVERLTAVGCSVVGTGQSTFDTRWTTLRDATGVTLDLVEDASLTPDATQMRHLRITVTSLAASIPWYEGLGFEVLQALPVTDAAYLGVAGKAAARAVRLRLPDEPFEALLVEWETPATHGRHVAEPNHAGLYRTAVGVDDTRAAYRELGAAGWKFDRAPMAVELHGTPVPDMWICFLSDPDGVPFEFVERPRAAFR